MQKPQTEQFSEPQAASVVPDSSFQSWGRQGRVGGVERAAYHPLPQGSVHRLGLAPGLQGVPRRPARHGSWCPLLTGLLGKQAYLAEANLLAALWKLHPPRIVKPDSVGVMSARVCLCWSLDPPGGLTGSECA